MAVPCSAPAGCGSTSPPWTEKAAGWWRHWRAWRHGALAGILEQILSRARGYFPDEAPVPKGPLVLPLADAAVQHQELAGGKAANLAVIRNVLGLPVPEGFVVTAAGFARFLAHHHLGDAIRAELDAISPLDPVGLL